jgi:signal transduction histidine kinase
MGEERLGIFIAIFSLIVLILMMGVIIFMLQYRKRKIQYDNEIERVNEAHKMELLNTQLQVQSGTMQTIGKELHDNLGQKITLASIYLQQVPLKKSQESLDEDISSVNKLLNDTLAELRRLSKTLVDQNISFQSLNYLLEAEAENIRNATALRVNLSMDCEEDFLNFQTKTNILRMFQEFSQNSIKHSKCKEINLMLRCDSRQIVMMCQDDGIGFDTQAKVKGIGLTNLNRRASEMGADLHIESQVGQGTLMTLKINKNNK